MHSGARRYEMGKRAAIVAVVVLVAAVAVVGFR